MFSSSAALYDTIYSAFKDYRAETARLVELIRRDHPSAHTALDVACGTGEHARLLNSEHGFAVDGLDLDPEFVTIAQRKLAHGTVFRGNMTSFALDRRYDVVLCLFSSIGYVRTLENVERTLSCFRAHLAPHGIAVVEPWFAPGAMESGYTTATAAKEDGVSVARVTRTIVDGRISRLEFEYLIGRATGIEHASEVHELGLFSTDELLECFRVAGLDAGYDPDGLSGRGLFVARVA
ncbi:MAG: class I SAM-dependent methyltransferase [Gemmatimonadaceae bacterium]